jgi:hypothetical protein
LPIRCNGACPLANFSVTALGVSVRPPYGVDDGPTRLSRTKSTKRPIDAFDQMNCSRVEAVGTGRCVEPHPRTTQGPDRQREMERAMGIEPTLEI